MEREYNILLEVAAKNGTVYLENNSNSKRKMSYTILFLHTFDMRNILKKNDILVKRPYESHLESENDNYLVTKLYQKLNRVGRKKTF